METARPSSYLMRSEVDDFPELKEIAQDLYTEFDPDMVLIEQKASGMPLTQELWRMGVPVTPYPFERGG